MRSPIKYIHPNIVSIAGLCFAVTSAILILKAEILLALLLYLVCGICDILDGAIARANNLTSPIGTVIDGLIDRLSDASIITALIISNNLVIEIGASILALVLLNAYLRTNFERIGILIPYGKFERLELFIATCLLFLFLINSWITLTIFLQWIILTGLLANFLSRMSYGIKWYRQNASTPSDPEETRLTPNTGTIFYGGST